MEDTSAADTLVLSASYLVRSTPAARILEHHAADGMADKAAEDNLHQHVGEPEGQASSGHKEVACID